MIEASPQDGTRYCFNADIPVHYSDAVLGVMLCNPHRLFVYWELPERLPDRDLPLLLRLSEGVHQTTGDSGATVEIEVPAGANSHYIEVPFPGLAYTIELVEIASDGSRKRLLSAQQLVPGTVPAGQPEVIVPPSTDTSGNDADAAEKSSGASERKNRRTVNGLPDINPRLLNRSSWSFPG